MNTIFLAISAASAIQLRPADTIFSTMELTAPWSVVQAVPYASVMPFAAWGTSGGTTNLKGGENMKIDLTSREVPKPDEQPGVFAEVVETKRADKRGRVYNYLVLVGELAATKSSGVRFTALTGYNLDDARGIKELKADLKVWRGSDAIPDLKDFDPMEEFRGKTFLAKPTVVDKGGKRQIQFSSFKRYTGDQPLTVSAEFVSEFTPTK